MIIYSLWYCIIRVYCHQNKIPITRSDRIH